MRHQNVARLLASGLTNQLGLVPRLIQSRCLKEPHRAPSTIGHFTAR